MGETNKQSYLTKILTLIVKLNKGVVRIPAQELMSQDVGNGIRIWWDDSTKELVLDYMPNGAKVYVITEERTWLTNEQLPPQLPQPTKPLAQDELIARVWTDSAGTPTNQETRSPQNPQNKNRVTHLSDLSMATAEMEKRKAELLKELADHPGQRERAPIPSASRTTFYKS